MAAMLMNGSVVVMLVQTKNRHFLSLSLLFLFHFVRIDQLNCAILSDLLPVVQNDGFYL